MAYRYLTLCVVAAVSLRMGQALTPPYLLFSTWFTVSHMNLDGSGYEVLVDSSSNVGPQAVDYHWRLGLLFWNHYRDDTVSQANLDGSDPITIASDVDTPNGLAVDWINDKLYFSYAGTAANTYHMATYDITAGGDFEIIMTSSVRYYEIAVDPMAQNLYWTAGNKLYRSSLTGQNAENVFTTTSLYCVFSLTLYTKLYWTEDCFGSSVESIRSLDLTTLEESIVIENSNVDVYYGVAVYEDNAYWTGNAHVYSTPVTGGGGINDLLHIVSYGGAQFRGIVVVHPDLQPDPRSSTATTARPILSTVADSPAASIVLSSSPSIPSQSSSSLSLPTSSLLASSLPTSAPLTSSLPTSAPLTSSLPTSAPLTSSLPTSAPLTSSLLASSLHTSAPITSTALKSSANSDTETTAIYSSSVSTEPMPSSEASDTQSFNPLTFIQNNTVAVVLGIAIIVTVSLAAVGCCVIIYRRRKSTSTRNDCSSTPVPLGAMEIITNENVVYKTVSNREKPPVITPASHSAKPTSGGDSAVDAIHSRPLSMVESIYEDVEPQSDMKNTYKMDDDITAKEGDNGLLDYEPILPMEGPSTGSDPPSFPAIYSSTPGRVDDSNLMSKL